MALFKPVIGTSGEGAGNGLELFVSADIYRYDIDNRPLWNLVDNDIAIKAAVDEIVDEIEDAYTGYDWPSGVVKDYTALDPRLDNMDIFLQELFDVRNVQYSSFVQGASFLRERYTSGFMNGPYPDQFIRSNFTMENNEAMPSPFGGFYVPEKARTVKDDDVPDETTGRQIAMETRIEQDGSSTWAATRKPIYVHMNGYVIPFFNAPGGTNDVAETVDSHRAAGNYGPVMVNFPPSPTTGHRFDFAFLEMWLEEIAPADDEWFYPYGSRDWSQWGQENLAVTAASGTAYSGQIDDRRDCVTKNNCGWEFYVIIRDTASAPGDRVDWDVDGHDAEGDGAGSIVDIGPSGYSITGTLDYDTMEWTIDFGTPPADGKYIVAGMRTKGFADPDNELIRGTISFLPNGNYLQVQHRIRVVPDVDYDTYSDWFSDPVVLGRAANAPGGVATYTFRNSLNDFHDGSMFHCGDGSSAAKTDLGTFDGYTYAVPLCAWSRFNTTSYSYSNQNGGVDRPDGLSHNTVDEKQFLDLRPIVLAERYDMQAAAANTLERIMRGDHRTVFAESMTDNDGDNTWVGQGIWGSVVPELWRVEQYTGAPVESNINLVRDIGLATSDDVTEGGYVPARAWHDGVRQVFSPQEEVQQVPISIVDVTSSNSATPEEIVTYAFATKTITLSTNDATLSGYSATAGQGVIINDTYPRLFWRMNRQPVVLSTLWSGLGTNTATAVIDTAAATYVANGTIDGFVDLLYPESTGLARPLKEVDGVEFDDGVNNYITQIAGNDDGSADTPDIVDWKLGLSSPLEPGYNLPNGVAHSTDNTHIFVCDSANNRVVKLLASDLSYVAQWPTLANYPVDFSAAFVPATDLKYPVDVAVDSSDNVYVVDRDDHRMVKLNSTLTTLLSSFGTSGVPTNDPADTTELNSPEGVTVDGADNVFIADTGLYRLVKLNSSLAYQTHIGNGISGAGKNQFIQPMGLDVGNVGGDDYVYVADQSRVVQVDATQMTVDNILGTKQSASVQAFLRHTYSSFWGFAEDANENKYCVNGDRSIIYKFDAAWNLLKTFGEDGVMGWRDPGTAADVTKQKHVQYARDLIYDDEASLIYVADNSHEAGDLGRILVLNLNLEVQDILYLNTTNFTQGPTGLAFYQDAGTGAKLYAGGGGEVIKLALPVPGSRGDTSLWSETWLLDKTTTGFTAADQLRHIHDIELTADGTLLFIGDVMRGEVIKVNPTTSPPTQVGSRTDIGYSWAPPTGDIGSVFGLTLSPDELELWVCGHGDAAAGYNSPPLGHIRAITVSTMAIAERLIDTQNWIPNEVPFNIRYSDDGNLMYLMMDEDMLVYDLNGSTPWLNITGTDPGDIAGSFAYNINNLPLSIDLGLGVPWINCRAVHVKSDILYVADPEGNTLSAIHLDSLRILGQINSPAMVGRGKASTAGPSGVVVINQEIFFADTLNNRVVKGYRFFPSVERGTGRLQYLIAPPKEMTVTYQARYAPYQGQWNQIGEGAVYGRHFVTDNNLMYISTMGRGTPTYVSPGSGTSFYSNMLSHIPMPIDVPSKAQEGNIGARIKDEYLFAPELLPLTDGAGSAPFLQLPILNRFPSSAQEVSPWYAGGSRFDFNRFFFLQGPGSGNAVNTAGTPITDTNLFTPRGFYANSLFPGFDTLVTFPLQALSIPRVIFSTMTVELEGQGYLLIYSSYRAAAGNTINDGSSITADVFKLFGSPGIKTRY